MSLRDEIAKTMYEAFGGDIARVNFEHAADALMPLVERAARESALGGIAAGLLNAATGKSASDIADEVVAKVLK